VQMMTLLEPIEVDAPAKPSWSRVTHRTGWILRSIVSPLADLPPYDPDPKWTEAALAWSGQNSDDAQVREDRISNKGELKLGVIRAKRAAQIVTRNHGQYNDLIAQVIGAKREITLKVRDEAPAVRFDPGLIVDLPAFTITRDHTDIATGRLCLTICLHESRSKIWTRTSSINDSAWGNAPCDQLKNLVETSRAWFEAYAPSVMDLYARNISEALLATGEKREIDVELAIVNKMELVSGDTTLKGLGRLSAAVANDEDVYRRDDDSAESAEARKAAQQLDLLVKCVPGMGLKDDGASRVLRRAPTTLDGNRYFFVPHRTARGFRGAFIVRAHRDELLFAGIASTDPEPYVTVERLDGPTPTRPVANSASQHVTAELANTVAKYF
jgi:hypothetical protein